MSLAVHLAPLPDELLSSWVFRTCHANATSLYSLLWHHGLNKYAQVDLDQSKNTKLTHWIGNELMHPEGMSGVHKMSLLPILDIEEKFPKRSWIRGIDRRAYKWRAFRYCSTCLSEDERPYFRRYWRFDWYEVCHRHKVRMHSVCGKCDAPLILHRVRWQRPHLAHCYSCNADLRQEKVQPVSANGSALEAVAGIFSMLNAQDKETYAAVHFLEAFVDQLIRMDGIESFVQKAGQHGFRFETDEYDEFPFLFRTVVAYRLWHEHSGTLKRLISDNQNYFNLVVRSFGCPEVMDSFHLVLRQEIDLTDDLIREIAMQIEATGRQPTVKRVSKRLLCSTEKLRRFLEDAEGSSIFHH